MAATTGQEEPPLEAGQVLQGGRPGPEQRIGAQRSGSGQAHAGRPRRPGQQVLHPGGEQRVGSLLRGRPTRRRQQFTGKPRCGREVSLEFVADQRPAQLGKYAVAGARPG
jgi:hypothetical protein